MYVRCTRRPCQTFHCHWTTGVVERSSARFGYLCIVWCQRYSRTLLYVYPFYLFVPLHAAHRTRSRRNVRAHASHACKRVDIALAVLWQEQTIQDGQSQHHGDKPQGNGMMSVSERGESPCSSAPAEDKTGARPLFSSPILPKFYYKKEDSLLH
jgi:hypothetical protein